MPKNINAVRHSESNFELPVIKTLDQRYQQVIDMYNLLYQTVTESYFDEHAQKIALNSTKPSDDDDYVTLEAKALQIEGLSHVLLNDDNESYRHLQKFLNRQNHENRIYYDEIINELCS